MTVRSIAAAGRCRRAAGPARGRETAAWLPANPGASSHHVDPGVLLALARELYGACPGGRTS